MRRPGTRAPLPRSLCIPDLSAAAGGGAGRCEGGGGRLLTLKKNARLGKVVLPQELYAERKSLRRQIVNALRQSALRRRHDRTTRELQGAGLHATTERAPPLCCAHHSGGANNVLVSLPSPSCREKRHCPMPRCFGASQTRSGVPNQSCVSTAIAKQGSNFLPAYF